MKTHRPLYPAQYMTKRVSYLSFSFVMPAVVFQRSKVYLFCLFTFDTKYAFLFVVLGALLLWLYTPTAVSISFSFFHCFYGLAWEVC